MILAVAVALGLIISLVRYRGHTFQHIASIPLQGAWLVLLALLLQWPLLASPVGAVQRLRMQQALLVLSHLLLLVFVWQNRGLAGVQIMGLGVVGNLLVILANGGFMPITPDTLVHINPGSTWGQWPVGAHYGYSKDLILLREQTRLWALSDILVLPPPFPRPTAFSLGDGLIAIGVVVLLLNPGRPSKG